MDATRAEIISSFVTLRRLTDPRGHELLDSIRDLCLSQCDVTEKATELAEAAVFRCEIDESAGLADAYAVTDPKHNGFHSLHADLWDNREKW